MVIVVGIVLSFIIMRIPISKYKKISRFGMIGIIAVLIALKSYGTISNSAQSWLNIFGLFTLQPSEFAKSIVILYLAFTYGTRKTFKGEYDSFIPLIPCLFVVGLVVLEPDLGTACIILGITTLIFFSLPFPNNKLILYAKTGVVVAGAIGLVIIGNSNSFLTEMQSHRLTFLKPCSRYKEDTGYQVCNGYIAMNNGGIFGMGIGKSTQKYLYLPEAHTDFIFPIIVEETGLIGGVAILLLYMLLLFRIIAIARGTRDLTSSIICYGTFAYLFLHMVVNLGGILALIPLTGVPLPFMSYGGSYMLNLIILLSLCQRVVIENKQRKYRSEFRKIMGG
jgi:cell division protein FtsW